jgi:osmotically-inducible protein OsmY
LTTANQTRTKSDQQIQRDVLDALRFDARVQPNEIGVAVRDHVVTLSGTIDSYAKKRAGDA